MLNGANLPSWLFKLKIEARASNYSASGDSLSTSFSTPKFVPEKCT
jgi:hypothetical protein